MKKVLLALTLIIPVVLATAQDTKTQTPSSNNHKSASLDGSSYKVNFKIREDGNLNDRDAGNIKADDQQEKAVNGSDMKMKDDGTRVDVNPSEGKLEQHTDFAGKSAIIHFKDGQLHSAMIEKLGYQAGPYMITSSDDEIVSFSAQCTNDKTGSKALWSGQIQKGTIQGFFTISDKNGENSYYFMKGAKATQEDLESEKQLGVR